MSQSQGFRPTGVSNSDQTASRTVSREEAVDFFAMEPREQLKRMLREHMADRPFSELSDVTFDSHGASLIGHILLDTIEEAGYSVDDFDAVGALTAAAVPMVCAMMHAAASRGEPQRFRDGLRVPLDQGPSIEGKHVLLLDAWLSEKSYVQTSSLVTLRNGNELSLDFGIVEAQGAEVVAVASLIGGVDMVDPVIRVVNPADDSTAELPFIEVFRESELH